MIYQTSSSGMFQFVQTQPGGFGFWANVEGTNATSQDPISVHYIYSVPIFSAGEAPPGTSPTVEPLEWVLLVPVVVAGWFVSIRLLRGGGRRLRSRHDAG
jgi:hypothetical protein